MSCIAVADRHRHVGEADILVAGRAAARCAKAGGGEARQCRRVVRPRSSSPRGRTGLDESGAAPWDRPVHRFDAAASERVARILRAHHAS